MSDFMDGSLKKIFEFIWWSDVYSYINVGCIKSNESESGNTILVSTRHCLCNIIFIRLIHIFNINMEIWLDSLCFVLLRNVEEFLAISIIWWVYYSSNWNLCENFTKVLSRYFQTFFYELFYWRRKSIQFFCIECYLIRMWRTLLENGIMGIYLLFWWCMEFAYLIMDAFMMPIRIY
jgi:hypothetical protein